MQARLEWEMENTNKIIKLCFESFCLSAIKLLKDWEMNTPRLEAWHFKLFWSKREWF